MAVVGSVRRHEKEGGIPVCHHLCDCLRPPPLGIVEGAVDEVPRRKPLEHAVSTGLRCPLEVVWVLVEDIREVQLQDIDDGVKQIAWRGVAIVLVVFELIPALLARVYLGTPPSLALCCLAESTWLCGGFHQVCASLLSLFGSITLG